MPLSRRVLPHGKKAIKSYISGSNAVGVTKIIAGDNITLSPTVGTGSVTVTAAAGEGITSPLTTKGDIWVGAEVGEVFTNTRLGSGSDGQVLKVDSTNNFGLSWSSDTTTPGGSDKEIQYNNNGSLEGIDYFKTVAGGIELTAGNFEINPTVGTSSFKLTGSLEVSGLSTLRRDNTTTGHAVQIENEIGNAAIRWLPKDGGVPTVTTTSGNLWGVGPSVLWGSNSHLTYDLQNKRLGVGIDTPTTTLDIRGASFLSGNVGINDNTLTSYPLSVSQSADQKGIILTGYDDVSETLEMFLNATSGGHFKGSANTYLTSGDDIVINSANHIYYDVGSVVYDHIWRYNSAAGGSTPAVLGVFTGNGKFGIGTDSPSIGYKLDVRGKQLLSGSLKLFNGAITESPGANHLWASGTGLYWGGQEVYTNTPGTSEITGGGAANYISYFSAASTITGTSGLQYNGTKVDIAQTADDSALEIAGFDDKSGVTAKLHVRSNGLSRFQGSTDAQVQSSAGSIYLSSSEHMYLDVGTRDTYSHIFRDDTGEFARFKNARLGIGTTAPSTALDVVGTITAGDNSRMTIDDNKVKVDGDDLYISGSNDIILDANGANVYLSDGGEKYGAMNNNNANWDFDAKSHAHYLRFISSGGISYWGDGSQNEKIYLRGTDSIGTNSTTLANNYLYQYDGAGNLDTVIQAGGTSYFVNTVSIGTSSPTAGSILSVLGTMDVSNNIDVGNRVRKSATQFLDFSNTSTGLTLAGYTSFRPGYSGNAAGNGQDIGTSDYPWDKVYSQGLTLDNQTGGDDSPGSKTIWVSGTNLYWGTTQIDSGGGGGTIGGTVGAGYIPYASSADTLANFALAYTEGANIIMGNKPDSMTSDADNNTGFGYNVFNKYTTSDDSTAFGAYALVEASGANVYRNTAIGQVAAQYG